MFSVCVVVVVHGHEYVHCFGNPAHPRIHLYKKDALTHFDALVPAPGSGDDAAPASASAIVEVASSSDHHSVSFTSSPEPFVVIEETSSDDNDVPLVLTPPLSVLGVARRECRPDRSRPSDRTKAAAAAAVALRK
jgi:hypothetical protein